MSPPAHYGSPPFISARHFQIVMWTLCGFATLFLASRVAIRLTTKGTLMANDYFLVLALPALFAGAGLLQSCLGTLYSRLEKPSQDSDISLPPLVPARLTAAIELLWIAIYCVKFCFFSQFKFHKPPYAYVSVRLTRHYWATLAICIATGLFTFAQPIILCSGADSCRYFSASSTVSWEVSVSTLDIVTDLFVISIPIALVYMANYTRIETILNAVFKSLSLFAIAIAGTRLALQYDAGQNDIQYIPMTFWLAVEAAVALIAAGISSYRSIVLDNIAEYRRSHATKTAKSHRQWIRVAASDEADKASLQVDHRSEFPMSTVSQRA